MSLVSKECGVVGVAGSRAVLDFRIVFGVLVLVADDGAEWRSGEGSVFAESCKELRAVGFLALRGQWRFAWGTLVQKSLEGLQVHAEACWQSFDDAADGGAVRFPEDLHLDVLAECIGHWNDLSVG